LDQFDLHDQNGYFFGIKSQDNQNIVESTQLYGLKHYNFSSMHSEGDHYDTHMESNWSPFR